MNYRPRFPDPRPIEFFPKDPIPVRDYSPASGHVLFLPPLLEPKTETEANRVVSRSQCMIRLTATAHLALE